MMNLLIASRVPEKKNRLWCDRNIASIEIEISQV